MHRDSVAQHIAKVKNTDLMKEKTKLPEDLQEFTRTNPHSVEMIACLYMIKLLQEFKQEESENYSLVLGIVNALQAQKENRTNADNARLSLANGMMYELSSNISKLELKIVSYNNQMTLLKEYIKDNMALAKPKVNLITKKK
jgi:hypothetical protein